MELKDLRLPANLQETPEHHFLLLKAQLPCRLRKVLGCSEGCCFGDPQWGHGDGDIPGMLVRGRNSDGVTYICDKEVPSLPPLGHEAAQVTGMPCPRAMASPAPWLRLTQTELTRWEGEEEEEEEEEDDFKRQMDEDGVIGLGEDAVSPPWGDGEDAEEGSAADEGRWHLPRELEEDDEERGSSGGDEGPWEAESDGEPYPELSYEGQWGSGSSPEALGDSQALCQPHGCSTDGADISGLSDTSPGPTTPSCRRRGWSTARNTGEGHGQGWTEPEPPAAPLTGDLRDATSVEPIPTAQLAGMGPPEPGTAGLAPTREPWGAGTPPAPQLHNRVPKRGVPVVLPPKRGRQSRSLSPRQRHKGVKEVTAPSGTGTSAADSTQYGRGRLNHPLPDLSKVEARVKFDQSYQPPRSRALPARPSALGGPIGFKSPAEIVREVLLSSGEGVPPQPPTTAGLPQEFRSPRQATQLVQQLQDDYHKLLTKYAEAENTIDQLRLGARELRAVEGEIFHLGLRLEELKERLEPGARRQLPSQRLAQPHTPPAPSSPPDTHSPHPEIPVLVEGPQETAEDGKAVMGGLPRPLWHKQLQVEEDFGDLLEQYKHFKSLPESLSLEQLSLAESETQEEADGPAAGFGGPSKVSCRTRSLEEGTDPETSPLHPPQWTATPLPPREPPWPEGTQVHPSPATAEEPPATAKPPPGLHEPPRGPQSCCSSGRGSAAAQPQPCKEQRIVSPETDSGFVGSEASRVSPPVHTPEHRPPGTGTPRSLGLSIPVPTTLRPLRKREATTLPSETALMGIYPAGRQGGAGGPCLPPSTPLQSSSPHRWAESAGSEAGPDGDGTHTDSEVEGRSCASTGGHLPAMARGPASPPPSPETLSPTPLSPNPSSLQPAHCDLLGSRLERDQAIRALRDEVWRLRRRLEESLRHLI
ncbi:LOW QUALITY PROTEIN: AT-hook-containing transcription factor [Athene cunicularia]|uniref:LOW QUALITY PROTEIN: AT-hook-containing transcription factor n=1 Tax=Athene cunicularia TaxID=194338 RepID=UPI000EF74E92|nr:LOW QUALITY PROTEIN: AT-hook-containing transcription factor [Athene cunicularia]